MQITTIKTVIPSPEITPNQKASKKSGQRIGYYYVIYKSLKQSQKNDVVKCFYIKGLLNFGLCVIKEGSPGDSKDKHGRDITDRLKWQYRLHEELQGKVRVPKLVGSFEENGNYYLVVETIKGISLSKFIKSTGKDTREMLMTGRKGAHKIIDYMIQMISLLDNLHQQQVVHRDVTPANFMIMPNGKLALIDLELSYSIKHQYPTPAFTLGTYGYMSPEQIAVNIPTIYEDIFSAGAILSQIFGGIHPMKLTEGPYEDIVNRINFFIPDKRLGEVIAQCLDPIPEKRPGLSHIRSELLMFRQHIKRNKGTSTYHTFTKDDIRKVVQSGINAFSTPLFSDDEGWFSANIETPFDEKNKLLKARYASFSLGDSGILYTLAKAKSSGFDISCVSEQVQKALDRIELKYISRPDQAASGLHRGADGIAAALSEGYRTQLLPVFPIEWIGKLLEKESQVHNYASGIAGQGFANMYCNEILAMPVTQARLGRYVSRLINEQQDNGSWVRSYKGRKQRITKGYINGVSGIIHFLLTYAQHYQDTNALEAGKKGLNWLMKNAVSKNDILRWKSASGQPLADWFSEGSPGIALSFIKGYEITRNTMYKDAAIKALNANPIEIVDDNLSQQEGLSGLGEIYLEAYKVLEDQCWLNRASWIAQVVMQLKKTHPKYGNYWLVQDEKQPISSFMTGNAGVIHFLVRYCNNKLGLPLMVP